MIRSAAYVYYYYYATPTRAVVGVVRASRSATPRTNPSDPWNSTGRFLFCRPLTLHVDIAHDHHHRAQRHRRRDRPHPRAHRSRSACARTCRAASSARSSAASATSRCSQEVPLRSLPGVESVTPVLKPYKLASREFAAERTVVRVGGRDAHAPLRRQRRSPSSPDRAPSRAARCSSTTAARVRDAGATMLRGGAFKPRTSPYAFQGLGARGAATARRGPRRDRTAGRHRGDGHAPGGPRRRARGHAAGGRAQHAELRAARRAWPRAASGPPQARPLGDDQRALDGRRVHHGATATTTSCCASAASAPTRRRRATRSTSPRSRC